jgi:hypothetical protein
MARGWESKSVEAQQEGLEPQEREQPGDRDALERRRKRESVELSRRRIASELEKSRSDVHRAALQNALRHLDEELKKLGA